MIDPDALPKGIERFRPDTAYDEPYFGNNWRPERQPIMVLDPNGQWLRFDSIVARLAQITEEKDGYLRLNQALVHRELPTETRSRNATIVRLTREKEQAEATLSHLHDEGATIITEMQAWANEGFANLSLSTTSLILAWADRLSILFPVKGGI